jgi:hypothetical protein
MYGVALLLVLVCGQAEDKRIEELVTKLADNSWRVREAAQKELDQIGLPALPRIREGLRSDELERVVRCERLVSAINYREQWRPTRFSYTCNDRKVSEVVKDFEKESGTLLKMKDDLKDVKVSLDFKDKTYWEAVRLLADASGNHIVSGSVYPVCDVALSSNPGRGIATDGVAIANFDRIHKWDGNLYSHSPATLSLHFDVICEKRVHLHGYYEGFKVLEAETDSGEKLKAATSQDWPRLYGTNRTVNCSNIYFGITQPTEPCTKLKKLKVEVTLTGFSGPLPETTADWDLRPATARTFTLEFKDIELKYEK